MQRHGRTVLQNGPYRLLSSGSNLLNTRDDYSRLVRNRSAVLAKLSTSFLVAMVFSEYKKQRIIFYHFKGCTSARIKMLLEEEGMVASEQGIRKFLKNFQLTGERLLY